MENEIELLNAEIRAHVLNNDDGIIDVEMCYSWGYCFASVKATTYGETEETTGVFVGYVSLEVVDLGFYTLGGDSIPSKWSEKQLIQTININRHGN